METEIHTAEQRPHQLDGRPEELAPAAVERFSAKPANVVREREAELDGADQRAKGLDRGDREGS